MEGRDTERYHGRDALFGSAALARKAETVVLISKADVDDDNTLRFSADLFGALSAK